MENGIRVILNQTGRQAKGFSLPLGVPFATTPSIIKPEAMVPEESSVFRESPRNQSEVRLRPESGDFYLFPLDPVISVSCKNIIVCRHVAKGSMTGTVKESWSQDDCRVTFSGVLIGENREGLNEMVKRLKDVCACNEVLTVRNEWLNSGLGITKIVVEDYSFPHTKGLKNQAYSIVCYSDSSVNILEDL